MKNVLMNAARNDVKKSGERMNGAKKSDVKKSDGMKNAAREQKYPIQLQDLN